MLKKTMMLAAAVAALAAFAIPAPASAAGTHWTHNGTVVSNPTDTSFPFEGTLAFAVGANSFHCEVTVMLTVTGPTDAEITQFNVTTGSCTGSGFFAACKLKNDLTNLPWTVVNDDTDLTASKAGGNVTIKNEYEGAGCPFIATGTHLEFPSITITPTIENGLCKHLAVSGTSTTGAVASGSVTPELGSTSTVLGLVTVP